MNVRKATPENLVAHEYAHRFEEHVRFSNLCKGHLLNRTGNGTNSREKLRKLCKNSRYRKDEIAFTNSGFADHYMAKIYETIPGSNVFYTTEIMSVGTEGLFFNRFNMWDNDKDSIDFVLGVMVGK